MIKLQKDLVKDDIIQVGYGEEDNLVTVIVDEVINHEGTNSSYSSEIKGRFLVDDSKVSMWGNPNSQVVVIE